MGRKSTNNRFAILANDNDNADIDDDDAITTKINIAFPVLNQATGKTLEHGQLCQHPKYKDVWDRSYADKLGQLC